MTGKLFTLRPVQERALAMLRKSLAAGHRRPQLEIATGGGKTVVAAHAVHGALEKGRRPAFTVPFLSLIDQTVERFVQNGIPMEEIGVFQADHPMRRPDARVQVCSVQTLARRELPRCDVVFVDESHIQAKIIYDWMAQDPKRVFVGLSATPWAKGMGEYYDDLVRPTTLKELIDIGDCCKFRAFAPTKPDLTGVAIQGGDYQVGQLSDRMSEKSIVADVVQTWLDRSEGRPTLGFFVDRAHAGAVNDEFIRSGVRSAYVDAFTDSEERAAIKKLFHAGEIQVVCSVGTMIAGVDWDVRCIIFARPTKSPIIYVQAIGRGLRPAQGKDDLLILDHSNTTLELGLPTEIMFDKLRGGKRPEASGETEEKMPTPRECSACGEIVPAMQSQCDCGHVIKRMPTVKVVEGELEEIGSTKTQRKNNREMDMWEKSQFYGELKYYCAERGFAPGWAANKYRLRFGVWPNAPDIKHASPMRPTMATLSWIRSRQIAYAHRRQDGAQANRG